MRTLLQHRKQLLYLSNDQLWAYEWRDGALTGGAVFTSDRGGLEAFSAYMAEREFCPAWLLADLIEEDFQRHLLPHVRGKAGRALLNRRLAAAYRDTPYRYAEVQGRESGGRRDDEVLFTGLTNPAAITPWVQVMEEHQVALAGIYSMTMLSGALLKALALKDEHILLVSQHAGGLRQSYFHDGQLKFSRLTPTVSADDVAAGIVTEVKRTQEFLTSTRLLKRGDVLVAAVLGSGDQLAHLLDLTGENLELAYEPIDIAEAARVLGLEPPAARPASATAAGFLASRAEQLLLAQLARKAPARHYEPGPVIRFYRLWQTRLGLYGASAVTAMVAGIWLAANIWGSLAASASHGELVDETAALEKRRNTLQHNMPPSAARPANMKAAVLVERMLGVQGPMPGPMLALLSHALDQVPVIQLTALDWQAGTNGFTEVPGGADPGGSGSGTSSPAAKGPLSSRLLGVPDAAQQTLRIEAQVLLPPSEERAALDSMNQFAQILAHHPALLVAIERPPLDTRPNVKLSGKTGAEMPGTHAKFVLQLTTKP